MSALRYIGRKRDGVVEDKLFSSDLHYISNGGIVLSRSGSDDYFRLRVPDTDCPPLPRPTEPSDDGRVDIAEPNRWVTGGIVNTSNGWAFNPDSVFDPDNIVYHYVRTSYTCYSSGLLGPGEGKGIAAYFSTTYHGTDPVPPPEGTDKYSLCIADVCYLSFGGVSIGVTSFYYHYKRGSYTSYLCMATRQGTASWSFSIMNYLPTGVNPEHSGEFYLLLSMPVGTTSGYIGHIFLKHPGGYYYKASEIPLVGVRAATPVEVGRVILPAYSSGSYPLDLRMPGSYTCRSIRTQYPRGVSTQATLMTSVHDMGSSRALSPATYPDNVPLIWRASNSPFAPGDAVPAWTSPTGEYRYWQFQIPNFSDHNKLVERIELNITDPDNDDPDITDPDTDPDDDDQDDGDPGDGGPGDGYPGDGEDGGTGPGDDTPIEDPAEATTPLPRNVGIYYTFGDLSVSYYGNTLSLPASLLLSLNINNDWRAHCSVDLGSSAVATEEYRQRLYEEYIAYLQSGRHGESMEIPYPVDSVGGLRGALMMRLSAALMYAGREIIDNIHMPDIEAQLTEYIKEYLRTIEWVSSPKVSVTLASGQVNIDCVVSIYGHVEKVSLSLMGGV